MAIIEVEHLTKEYRLGAVTSLKDTLRHGIAKMTGRQDLAWERQRFKALDDVSFSIEEGEVVGIIGHNGAGKSTLLKHLANITTPTSGEVRVRGSVAPLIEVGAGLNPELTGRENIYLNGAILGISKKEIDRKLDEIIEFSELEEFIDTPVKRYSSGMTVKLGFSIATSIDADILIVDEVLAVGDLAFQRKCFDRMENMIRQQGKTVLLVSHNIRQVMRLCDRVMLLNHGCMEMEGGAQEVCDLFYKQNDEKIRKNLDISDSMAEGSGEAVLVEVGLLDEQGSRVSDIHYDNDYSVYFKVRVNEDIDNVTFGFGFHTTDFLYLTTHNSESQLQIPHLPPGEHDIVCSIKNLPLLPGVYSIRFGITAGKAARTVYYGENLKHLQVVGHVPVTIRDGFFALDGTWALGSRGVITEDKKRKLGQ